MTPMLSYLVPLLLLHASSTSASNCAGCVPLDTLTFDKVVSKFSVSLIKFDVAYPYGDKHEAFAQVAKEASAHPDLLVGEVGIKDYGEKDNGELGNRFKVGKDDYPTLILFIKNNKEGSIDQHRYNLVFNAENIKTFLKAKSGIYLPLKGCIEDLDIIADNFAELNEDKQKQNIRFLEEKIKDFEEDTKKSGDIYLKIMRKLTAEGTEFLVKEDARIKKLLAGGKLSNTKKEDMQLRLNILKSFKYPAPAEPSRQTADEL